MSPWQALPADEGGSNESEVDSETCATVACPAVLVRSTGEQASSGTPCCTSDPRIDSPPRRLAVAYARSGDKGINANIGVIPRRPGDYPRLCREVTALRVAAYFGLADAGRVSALRNA